MIAIETARIRAVWIGLLLTLLTFPPAHAAIVKIDGQVPKTIDSADGVPGDPDRYIIGYLSKASLSLPSESAYVGLTNSFIDLTIQNASVYTTGAAYIGYGAVQSISATVTGAGSRWESNSGFYVGYDGREGSLRISNGGRVAFGIQTGNEFALGRNATANDNAVVVTGSGSTLSGEAWLHIGVLGSSNSVRIEDSGLVEVTAFGLGSNASGNQNSLVITGDGSLLRSSASQASHVGGQGRENSLRVEAGGQLIVASDLVVGKGSSSGYSDHNSVSVTGDGSAMESAGELVIGTYGASNLLSVSNRGSILTASSRIGIFGSQNQATIAGFGSVWENTGSMVIGEDGSENAVVITEGALVKLGGSFVVNQGEGTENYLRLDGGFFAWAGDQTEEVTTFLEAEIIQIWNGTAWESAVDGKNFQVFYYLSNEEAFSFTGYHDLGGFTILSSLASDVVPEPATWMLVGGVILAGALLRRKFAEKPERVS